MSYDPTERAPGSFNQPPPPPYGAPNQPPYGTPPQTPPPYGAPNQPPYGTPQIPTGYGVPDQQSYGIPPYAQAPQPPKKSRRGLWIALSIVAGVLVLACGGCAVFTGFFASLIGAPNSTVDNYYKAVESQDYNTAYSYLQVDTFTIGGQSIQANETVFSRIGTTLDSQRGKVTKHTITSINVNNGTATAKVEVTRSGTPTYTVTLELTKSGNDWKITRFNNV